MQITNTSLAGVLIIQPDVFNDERGYLYESFKTKIYAQNGIDYDFVQDNVSFSKRNILRGLHFQKTKPQGKLIQVIAGEIYDVVVDIRPNSVNFGKYFGLHISSENHKQLWIPPGHAHGFCVLSATALVHYKCTDYYDAEDEAGIAWDCPHINIDWPIKKPVLSDKDTKHPNLIEFNET